jgi:hypothetical protein
MWLKMATCVRKVASEVFGVSRGGKQEGKDTWWWNDEVQKAIKEKECFKRLHLDKSAANIEGYKLAKRVAKRAVSIAKGKTYVSKEIALDRSAWRLAINVPEP